MIDLEEYKDVARRYRGTDASGAIVGLITEIKRLRAALKWAADTVDHPPLNAYASFDEHKEAFASVGAEPWSPQRDSDG